MKTKKFDSVKMMREIREKLRKKYENDPALRQKNLQRIRKKYGLKASGKAKVA